MMREVNYDAGWIDYRKGKVCLVLECGHVVVEMFDTVYKAPAAVDCRKCEENDGTRKRG